MWENEREQNYSHKLDNQRKEIQNGKPCSSFEGYRDFIPVSDEIDGRKLKLTTTDVCVECSTFTFITRCLNKVLYSSMWVPVSAAVTWLSASVGHMLLAQGTVGLLTINFRARLIIDDVAPTSSVLIPKDFFVAHDKDIKRVQRIVWVSSG